MVEKIGPLALVATLKEIMEELNSKEIIATYLNNIVDFYIQILSFSKPLVAAVDNYAIGVGFQICFVYGLSSWYQLHKIPYA